MLAAVSQLLSIITYSLYDYTVMIQLAPWISLKDSSEKVLESIPAGILSNKMLKKKKRTSALPETVPGWVQSNCWYTEQALMSLREL